MTPLPALAVTLFEDAFAKTKREVRVTPSELAELIRTTNAQEKARLPWLKLATFGPLPTEKSSLRWDGNVRLITGVEADYDAEKLGFDDAVEALEKAGILAVVYTSPSHSPAAPRWRVLSPFSTELPPGDRDRMMGRLNGLFGGVFGAESWTLSQSYYYGSVDHNPAHQVAVIEGMPIDRCDELDEIWLGKPDTLNREPGGNGQFRSGPLDETALRNAIISGAAYHESCTRLVGRWAQQGVAFLDAQKRLLGCFDDVLAADRDDRWKQRRGDVPRIIRDIYGKEAAKNDASSGAGANGAAEQDSGDEPDYEAEIARLAKLPIIAYERVREGESQRLGFRVSILDRLVKAERGKGEAAPGQGRPLDLPEPEPWPQTVDGAELLDELAAAIQRHVVLDLHEAAAVALWVLGVHAFDVWVIFPRLFITAPERRCGKTTLLDVLSRLVPRWLKASSITAAALFRTIEAACPTLLLDEADAYMRDNEDLRAVLDAGHRRDGAVVRTVGDNHEPRQFSAWAPIALAAIGHLPSTIEDRSIIVRLRRRRPDEPAEPLRLDRTEALDALARKTARWGADHREALAAADPVLPAGIYNRAADNWRPLLAVADLADGDWPERARVCAATLLSGDEDSESARVLLLADLRELFEAEASGALFTREILAALHKNETRPWPEWKGKPITDRQLAALLKPYEIQPKLVRRRSETGRGYESAWFEDAFARYLPARSVTALQTRDSEGFEPLRSVTPSVIVTDESRGKPSISAGCNAVRDENPLPWGERL
jgi:Protein of unknown function (DUF3631)